MKSAAVVGIVAQDARVQRISVLEWSVHLRSRISMYRELRMALMSALAGALGAAIHLLLPEPASQFWLGRIVTLPLVTHVGLRWGALAAAVCAAPLVSTRPIMATVIVAEALVVRGLMQRGLPSIVSAAIFWTATALAFAIRPGWFDMIELTPAVWPLALQLILNGMLGVVIASGLAAMISSWPGNRPAARRMRSYAFEAFVIAGIARRRPQ